MAHHVMKSALFCFCGLIFLCTISKACRCFVRHPQTNFCEAEYAIKAKILRKDGGRYRVKVLENYKSRYAKPLKFSQVWINSDSVCRIELDIRSTCIITGPITNDKLMANSCFWIVKSSALTAFQAKSLKNGDYKKNCNCKISDCPQNDCQQGDGCFSPYEKSSCYHQSAVCRHSPYSRNCEWAANACHMTI